MKTHKIAVKTDENKLKETSMLFSSTKIEKITAISKEEVFINKKTGEEIKAQTIVKRLDRNGFEITYLAYLFELFDILGNKKMKVFSYILKHKNADNQLIITVRELAKKTGVALSTAHETLKILEEKGLIRCRIGSLMVIPKVAHRGNKNREENLMIKFREFEQTETNLKNEANLFTDF